MRDAPPELSTMCTQSDHDRCPHWAGTRTPRPWRRPPAVELRVCSCSCHARCPMTADRTVPQEVWAATCTCPGAEVPRAAFERRTETNRVLADADFSGHPDAVEIESRLRAVFEEHGQTPPPGMATWSRLVAMRTARQGTRVGTGYRVAGGVAAAATVLTGAATASSGRRRLVLGVAALLAWLASGYAVTAASATGQFTRWAEDRPRAQDLPSR